tara:strand:+ start:199 stop:393 length:195 start_codon:yes stop_codon:yes gene_type:complete
MIRKLLFLFLFISFSSLAQDYDYQKKSFSQEIGKHIKQYKQKAQLAYAERDFERAKFLFGSSST